MTDNTSEIGSDWVKPMTYVLGCVIYMKVDRYITGQSSWPGCYGDGADVKDAA